MRKFWISTALGRRAMPRTSAPVIVLLSNATNQYSAELVDLSRTGARLKGATLPVLGEDLLFKAEKVRVTGTIVWFDDDHCAVEFDTPIAGAEVKRIRALSNFITEVGRPAS